jgi:hypothetical protein
LGNFAREYNLVIEPLAKGLEDYIMFSLIVPATVHRPTWKIRFLDSCAFLQSSLSDLVESLAGKNNEGLLKFRALATVFPNETQQRLLLRKGVYPYTYVNNHDGFNEAALPPMEKFYDELKLSNITGEDYQYALSTFREFGCRNIGDYSDLYLTVDVVQLADVLQNFREHMYLVYGLDPLHYATLPSFAWD